MVTPEGKKKGDESPEQSKEMVVEEWLPLRIRRKENRANSFKCDNHDYKTV